MNLTSTTANGFNFQMINSLMKSWGVSLAWLDFFAAKGMIYCAAKTTVILNTWLVSHLWLYDNMVSC